MANTTKKLRQCLVCGYLEGALTTKDRPCTSKTGKHRFQDLDAKTLASALGATGGRPPKYTTDEERREARLATFRRSNRNRKLRKEAAELLDREIEKAAILGTAR